MQDHDAADGAQTNQNTHSRFTRLPSVFSLVGAAALLLMVGVTFLDVLFRLANRPVTGAYELTAILVGLVVFSLLPRVTLRDEHVRAGLLTALIAQRPFLSSLLMAVRRLTLTLLFLYLAWAMFQMGLKFAATGDRAPFIELPLAPVAWFGALAFVVSAASAWFARTGTSSELS